MPRRPPATSEDPASEDAASEGAWRAETAAFRAGEQRRRFPLAVHVGVPAAERVSHEVGWPVPRSYDVGLRAEVVVALLGARPVPDGAAHAWLTRPGVPEPHDQDAAWHSAARWAFAAHGVRLLSFRAVTRTGWWDVETGASRAWKRLRP